MITFFVAVALLIGAYFTYGRFVERFFGADSSIPTPVKRLADGVDYQELKPWKIFVIQFLNIAGLGPIFGAILGAAYGPMAYLWIVVGCIFMGATHDYFSGMLSLRNDGKSLPDIVGAYLGRGAKGVLVVFTAFLLMAVGVAFVTGPADLIARMTNLDMHIWLYIIFGYYILATLLPVDKIIGKIYPFMGATLIFMAVAVSSVMIYKGFAGELTLMELTPSNMVNMHNMPDVNILFPMMFIVISCGAISGFHATQSPMMARCMSDEKYGRVSFYGAMICEGVVAMIWATAAMAFFGGADGLNEAAAAGKTPAVIVNEICNSWLGKLGAIIAIIGVVACPVTTGDTAFRSLRLLLADAFGFGQKEIGKRLIISIPLFVIAFVMCNMDFSTIWKYVGIGNQVLATIVLWTGAAYCKSKGKPHWLLSLPATFLTMVCVSYFLIAPYKAGGLSLSPQVAYISGAIVALALLGLMIRFKASRGTALLVVGILMLTPVFASAKPAADGKDKEQVKFIDAKELRIEGRAFTDSGSVYSRLPFGSEKYLRKELVYLGANSSGINVNFVTNSKKITIKWRVINNFGMNHMAATGVKGIDLYCKMDDGWRYVGTARPVGKDNEIVCASELDGSMREYRAYLPLYDGVESMSVGVDADAIISPSKRGAEEVERVLFYGTSITQGGCASRPGMSYTSIFARMSGCDVYNLGFSGNAKLDFKVAQYISSAKPHVIFVDCLPNCTSQIVRDSAYNFIKYLVSHSGARKVYMVSNPNFPTLMFNARLKKDLQEEDSLWRAIYDRLISEGYFNIAYIDGSVVIGDDSEATVDGVHYTDLGFTRAAAYFYNIYREGL